MKTKVVYVVISTSNDSYYEQAWASAFTLKYHNPSSYIMVVTDYDTKNGILHSYRKKSLQYIDEIKAVEVPEELNNMQRSRWIKTNLRELINGSYLFIDTDTIITEDLSEIDNLKCSVGAVLDWHSHTAALDFIPYYKEHFRETVRNIFEYEIKPETDVFNSGVMYVKDDEAAHQLYRNWHKNWNYSREHGKSTDQPALTYTCDKMDNPIAEISGVYNCQLKMCLKYLAKAKILHLFTGSDSSSVSPILGTSLYEQIKTAGCITKDVEFVLLNSKESFSSPTYILGGNDYLIYWDKTWELLLIAHKQIPKLYNMLNKASAIILSVVYSIGHIIKRVKTLC